MVNSNHFGLLNMMFFIIDVFRYIFFYINNYYCIFLYLLQHLHDIFFYSEILIII